MHSMKRMVFAGLLLVSACAGAALSRVVIPPAHAQATRRWEHFCFMLPTTWGFDESGVSKKLTEAGREGWELVGVANSQGFVYCMKRPAP